MADYIPIDDAGDPRIADYLNIRDRDLKDGHGGRFVAEGETVLAVLLGQARYRATSLLIAESRVASLRARIDAGHDGPVYVARQGLMDAIVGFPIHRGILALAERGALPSPGDLLAGTAGPVLGLVGIANHDNMGGLFRNAAAFGAGAVLLDDTCCDPFYRKAIRVSVGGVLKTPFARAGSGIALVERLRAAGIRPIALSPRGDRLLKDVDRSGRIALILGTEGPGLPDAVLDLCETVRIPMAGGFDSLNVATTGGIALYELTR